MASEFVPNISSKVIINCIDDPTQIHGNLGVVGAPLSQAYSPSGGTCVPDWESPNVHPTIYLSLLKGDVQRAGYVQQHLAEAEMVWTMNGIVIPFDTNGSSVVTPSLPFVAGTFVKSTYRLPSTTIDVPALEICHNIAGPDNQDNDILGLSMKYKEENADIPIELSVNIRIGTVTANGYWGVLWPAQPVRTTQSGVPGGYKCYKGEGDFALEDDDINGNGVVALYAVLYSPEGEVAYVNGNSRNYVTNFHIGASEVDEHYDGTQRNGPFYELYVYDRTSGVETGPTVYPGLLLTDAEVIDYAIIECDYFKRWDGETTPHFVEQLCSAHAEVDDVNDVEMMYISAQTLHGTSVTESGEGNVTYLRNGESVKYKCWIGKKTISAFSSRDTIWKYFYIKFLNNLEQEYLNSFSPDPLTPPTIPDVISTDPDAAAYGYRPIYPNATDAYGEVTIAYDNVIEMGSKVTGWIAVYTNALPTPN